MGPGAGLGAESPLPPPALGAFSRDASQGAGSLFPRAFCQC